MARGLLDLIVSFQLLDIRSCCTVQYKCYPRDSSLLLAENRARYSPLNLPNHVLHANKAAFCLLISPMISRAEALAKQVTNISTWRFAFMPCVLWAVFLATTIFHTWMQRNLYLAESGCQSPMIDIFADLWTQKFLANPVFHMQQEPDGSDFPQGPGRVCVKC
jgi:hypothetical protein